MQDQQPEQSDKVEAPRHPAKFRLEPKYISTFPDLNRHARRKAEHDLEKARRRTEREIKALKTI